MQSQKIHLEPLHAHSDDSALRQRFRTLFMETMRFYTTHRACNMDATLTAAITTLRRAGTSGASLVEEDLDAAVKVLAASQAALRSQPVQQAVEQAKLAMIVLHQRGTPRHG